MDDTTQKPDIRAGKAFAEKWEKSDPDGWRRGQIRLRAFSSACVEVAKSLPNSTEMTEHLLRDEEVQRCFADIDNWWQRECDQFETAGLPRPEDLGELIDIYEGLPSMGGAQATLRCVKSGFA